MSDYSIADFDRFRLFRDSGENVVSLDAQTFGEQLFPVLDCEFFRLARLHMYEGAALKPDWLEAFDKEMELLSEIEEPMISRPFTWGRDDDELFYINHFLDGEGLHDYIKREGARSPHLAASWLLPFVELLDRKNERPMSILRFSNMNLQVVRNLETNQAELHFTEFTAWTKPGNLVVERGPEFFLAQSFCSLISGIPIRDFTESSVPRQFDYLPDNIQAAVIGTFEGDPGSGSDAFFDAIREMAKLEGVDEEELVAPQPRSSLRAWIRQEHANIPELAEVPILAEKAAAEADMSYATETMEMELPTSLQFFPGPFTIPREGWFEQHWISLRRKGRTFVNQLAINEVEEHGSITVINEESPNGIHLRHLIRETGPLDLDHAVAMARKLSSSLDGLESSPSAVPVWFLPEQNVFLNFGSRDPSDFSKAIENSGSDFWERIPFRLRLHQTMVGLIDGIHFPKSLRSNAFELAKENPHIRRTAVLLPLIGAMLSGKRFEWDEKFALAGDDVPPGLVVFINKTREQLLDKPHLLELGFLNKLADLRITPNPDDQWDHDTYEKEVAGNQVKKEGDDDLPINVGWETLPSIEEQEMTATVPIQEAGVLAATEALWKDSLEENDAFGDSLSDTLGSDAIEFSVPLPAALEPPVEEVNLVEEVVFVEEVSPVEEVMDREKTRLVPLPEVKTEPIQVKAEPVTDKTEPIPPKKPPKKKIPLAAKKTAPKKEPVVSVKEETSAPQNNYNPIAAQIRESPGKELVREEENELVFSKPKTSSGAIYNPIAEVTEGGKLDRGEVLKPVPKKAAQPAEAKANGPTVLTPEPFRSGLGWIWIVIAAIFLGGGVGFYLHGKANHAGLYAQENEIEFPRSEYHLVSPKVNPFTNEIELEDPEEEATPIAVLDDVTDLGTALAKSKIAVEDKKYSSAVDLALWGLQMNPDSVEVGAQLEAALLAWIKSGVDAPAKTTDPSAVSVLAEYYIKNRPSEGLYILLGSATNGNEEAMRILGLLFGQGKIVPRSVSIAERWLRAAAEKGDQDACFYLGESSVFGTLVKANTDGFAFVEKAAEAGHARSLLFRGYCALEGKGMEKDEERGYTYISRAAEKASLEALFQKGLCHANGLGTDANPVNSAGAFKTAANLGHVSGMYRYAQCLILGYGTEAAYADGVSWMKKAAAAGHSDARIWCQQHQAEFKPVAGP